MATTKTKKATTKKSEKKKSTTKQPKKTYIYGLFSSDGKCYYIGETGNPDRRKEQHLDMIGKNRHKIKQLNTLKADEVEFRLMCEIDTDNSLLVCVTESSFNSIFRPFNKCVWMAFRATCTFARVDSDTAKALIKCVVKSVGGEIHVKL